jgi:hypothetical protein
MKFDELRIDIKVKYSSWDKMNTELGGNATDEQITNLFCTQYTDIWFYKWSSPKETTKNDIRIDFTPSKCEYIENKEF